MPILIKLIIDGICGILNAWGGHSFLFARRYLIPFLLAVNASLLTHLWWVGLMLLPVIGTLSIGYSKDSNFGRALWIGMQCFVLGLGLFLTHHLAWYFYVPYVIFGCVLGGIYRNWFQIIGDTVTGCYLGLIIFMIH